MALKGHRLDLYIGSAIEKHRGKVSVGYKWMVEADVGWGMEHGFSTNTGCCNWIFAGKPK